MANNNLDLFANENLDLFSGENNDLDLFADKGYSLSKDLSKLGPETGKAAVQTYENFAKAMGGVINWVGENIANDDPISYKDPLGKQQIIEQKKSEFHKQFGLGIAADGKRIYDFWDRRMKSGWEAPDKETFEGEYFENPSITRTSAMLVNGLGSLATALVVAKATNNPAFAAQALGLVEGQESYQESRRAGKSVKESNVTGALSTAGNTILESLPIVAFLKGTSKTVKKGMVASGIRGIQKAAYKIFPKVAKGATPSITKEMVTGMVVEGGEEGAQQFWTNLVAKIGYDDTRDLGQGVIDAILGGALTGGVAVPSIGAARGLDNRIKQMQKRNDGSPTNEEVGRVATMLAKQVLANSTTIDDSLKKELGLFEQKIEGPSNQESVNNQFDKFASEGIAVSDRQMHDVDVNNLVEKHQVSYREIDNNLVEGIQETIKAGKYVPPILVNKEADGTLSIIAGHHRVAAYKALGIQTVPATVVQVSDQEAKKMAALDNEGNRDTPSIYGKRYRTLIEKGMSLADALREVRGFVNDKLAAEAPSLINVSYLPEPIRRAVDLGEIPMEVGSEIGSRIKVYGVDLTPEVITNLVKIFHVDQGVSGKALGRILDTVLSVAQSRTSSKEKQFDLFGKMIQDTGVLNAVGMLEKELRNLGTIKKQKQDFINKSKKFNVKISEEDSTRLDKEIEAAGERIKELRAQLYKFKVDDFVGTVKTIVTPEPTPFDEPAKESESQPVVVETSVEPGADKTFYIPNFENNDQAKAFGLLNRLNPDVLQAMRTALASTQQPIVEALQLGKQEEAEALSRRANFLKLALEAAEKGAPVAPGKKVKPLATQQMKVKEAEAEKPNEEKDLKEKADKAALTDKVAVILSTEESTTPSEEMEDGVLKEAVKLKEKREAQQNSIEAKDREVMVATFEVALQKYGIDQTELAKKIKEWVKVFRNWGMDPGDLLSYAWEGAMKAMGAEEVEADLLRGPEIKTKFNPDFDYTDDGEAKKGKTAQQKKEQTNLDKFFRFAKRRMFKEIVDEGLPAEKLTISISDHNITNNLHNFSDMMQDLDSVDEVEERWAFYMPKSLKYTKGLFDRFMQAYRARVVASLDAPLGDSDTTLEGVLDSNPTQAESFGGSEEEGLTSDEIAEQAELDEAKAIERDVKRQGAMAAFEKAFQVLPRETQDILKLAFGLTKSMYGVIMTPAEIADVLNAGMSTSQDSSPALRSAVDELSDETKNMARGYWNEKRVRAEMERAIKQLANVPDLIAFFEQEGGRRADVGVEFDSADEMEDGIFGMMDFGNKRGSVLIPFPTDSQIDVAKRKATRAYFWGRKTKHSVMMPFWLARRFKPFAGVFDPVVKAERKYSRDTYFFKRVMNNFSDLIALGKKRADRVAEVFYQNDSAEEEKLAEARGEQVRWYSPEELRARFGFDDEQIAVFHQFVKARDFVNALLVRKFKTYNDYYKKRTITNEEGDLIEESDEEFALRRMRIDLAAHKKFPRVHVPIYRYGDTWVVAKKFSHIDKKGKPVYDTRMDLVTDKEVHDIKTAYEKDGWQVSVNEKAEFKESSWKLMDLYTLERLMDHAGVHWEQAKYREGKPINDLARLQTYVDKLRAAKGGLYGHFLKRKRIPGFKTSAEHLKRSMIDFFESSSRTLRSSEARMQAEEALKQMPHGDKTSKQMNQLYDYASEWLQEYGHYNSEGWAKFRTGVYLMALTTKPSWFVQNLTQPFFTTYLKIAVDIEKMKLGVGMTEKVFTEAYADSMNYIGSKKFKNWKKLTGGVDPNLDRMLVRAEREGVVKGTFTDALLAIKEIYDKPSPLTAAKSFFSNRNYRNTILSLFGSASERLNRVHAFAVGYKVGVLKGYSGNMLYEFASEYVGSTQYNYGNYNVPLAISKLDPNVRGAVMTAMLFNSYSLNWIQMTSENISTTLANIGDGKKEYGKVGRIIYRYLMLLMSGYVRRSVLMTAMGHGTRGLFGYWLGDLISTKTTGKHLHRHVRDFIYHSMPEVSDEAKNALVRIVTSGFASHATNIDFARLIGYGDVLNMNLTEDYRDLSDVFLGAAYSLAKNVMRAPGLIGEGVSAKRPGFVYRGVEGVAPGGGRGVFKALRAKAEKGFYTEGGLKIKDVEKGDLARTALGFMPLSLSEEYERIKSENLVRKSKEEIQQTFNRRIIEARRNKDKDMVAFYKKLYRKWNEDHPDKQYVPDWDYINKASRTKPRALSRFALGSRKEVKQIQKTYKS